MLEQLRMQEVSQIILSKPEGAVIRQNRINPQEKGVEYGDFEVGEPVMIINNPSLSNLSFVSKPVVANDAQGHIGTAGITKQIDFVVNEGSILYALWSYIYGLNDENPGLTKIRGNEYLETKSSKLNTMTIAELNKKAKYLRSVLSSFKPNTKEFHDYNKALRSVNTRLKELRSGSVKTSGIFGRLRTGEC